MPVNRDLPNFGFVYGISGTARGTTTSSGVFNINTGFARRVVFQQAYEQGNGLRNSSADPAATTGVGTFAEFVPITIDSAAPTQARFRVRLNRTLSAASSVTTLTRAYTFATVVTGITCRWLAFGY